MNLSLLRLGTIIIPLCGENRSSFFARYHIYQRIFNRRIIRCRIFFFFLFKIERDFEEKRIRVRTNMDRLERNREGRIGRFGKGRTPGGGVVGVSSRVRN